MNAAEEIVNVIHFSVRSTVPLSCRSSSLAITWNLAPAVARTSTMKLRPNQLRHQ